METIHVARQPIYDRSLDVYAYELLFRSNASNQADVFDGDQATSEVVVNSMMDTGLENIVGQRLAFINMTRGFLTGVLPLPLMKEQVVLEVLEDITPDIELIAGLKDLASAGYIIALDDFVFRPELQPLLDIAHIVKLDVMALSPDALSEHVDLLRQYPLKLLAEKVETHEEMVRCKELGFDFFQGYFFCQPETLIGKRPEGNRLIVLELLSKLQNAETDAGELEKLIARDASLAYRLLNYINSAFFELRSTVTSIKHALSLLGPPVVRQWASLILMVQLSDGKPPELLVTGMVRARMCELIGGADPDRSSDQYFTVGLFSILEALMDTPLPEILNALPLSSEAKSALIEHSGVLGETLMNVLDYERGRSDRLDDATGAIYQAAYVDTLQWCRDSQQTLGS